MGVQGKKAFANYFSIFLTLVLGVSSVWGQSASVTVSLDEKFFDSLLSSVFQNFDAPEFSIANKDIAPNQTTERPLLTSWTEERSGGCSQTVKILREMNGIRTSVKFREGKIYVPLAFSGTYSPPFVGCVEFAGWAEANVDLEFEQKAQRLVGRIRVLNVNLNGTGGIGGTLISRLLQASVDKKMNPIEILTLDKLSFAVPIQGKGKLRMAATGVKPVMGSGVINIHIEYAFFKE